MTTKTVTSIVENHPKSPEQSYPCLMRRKGPDSGYAVLFSRYGEGTVVHAALGLHPLGHHSNDWCMDFFEPFDGHVQISSCKV